MKRNAGKSVYSQRNIRINKEAIWGTREKHSGRKASAFYHVCKKIREGQKLWLQVNAACVGWQKGCPVYLVIFIDVTDITELREMQKKSDGTDRGPSKAL